MRSTLKKARRALDGLNAQVTVVSSVVVSYANGAPLWWRDRIDVDWPGGDDIPARMRAAGFSPVSPPTPAECGLTQEWEVIRADGA